MGFIDDVWNSLYNTELSPQDEQLYQQWAQNLAHNRGFDPSNIDYDYDMRGYWKKYSGDKNEGHFTDEFKKPNHPTFSNQSIYNGANGNVGGTWDKNDDGTWAFTPSATNLLMHSPGFLQSYFDQVEPGNQIKFSILGGNQ